MNDLNFNQRPSWFQCLYDIEKRCEKIEDELRVLEQESIDFSHQVNKFLTPRVNLLYLRYFRQRSRGTMRLEWRNYSVARKVEKPLDGFDAVVSTIEKYKNQDSICKFIVTAENDRLQFNAKYQFLKSEYRSCMLKVEGIKRVNALLDNLKT